GNAGRHGPDLVPDRLQEVRLQDRPRLGGRMLKRSGILLALLLVAGVAVSQTAPVDGTRGTAVLTDGMRGATAIADEPKPPALGNPENKDIRRERSYSMQPPTIPHKIDNYQVDKN